MPANGSAFPYPYGCLSSAGVIATRNPPQTTSEVTMSDVDSIPSAIKAKESPNTPVKIFSTANEALTATPTIGTVVRCCVLGLRPQILRIAFISSKKLAFRPSPYLRLIPCNSPRGCLLERRLLPTYPKYSSRCYRFGKSCNSSQINF
jgi:hypothetical protein